MNLPSAFTRYRDAVDDEMRSVIGADDALLYQLIRYHMGWEDAEGRPIPGTRGKGLRPLLCMLAWEGTAPGADADGRSYSALRDSPALPAAAAIELIHNFSLIHDDIQDQDAERHHRPTVWKLWGVPQAINAGDGLWALATRAFLRTVERGVPADVAVRAHRMLNDACLTMIEGQSLDLAFEHQQVDVDRYLDMISRKTGALIATALAIGALIGSRDDAVAAGFYRFGQEIGRAFQIQDDVLGIWGQEAVTGKSASSDIRRRKQSYPVVYTLSRGPAAASSVLAQIYTQPEIDDADVARATWALEESSAREQATRLAAESHERALRILDRLPAREETRRELAEITAFLLAREF
jgi:geranylgeranyl diphosphate synthase type I